MSTYAELIAQAKALMAQAETVRQTEKDNALAEIRKLMVQFDITIEDLGTTGRAKKTTGKSKGTAKFKGPNGEPWSGGPGRKPEWVKAVLAAGGNIDDYRV